MTPEAMYDAMLEPDALAPYVPVICLALKEQEGRNDD